MHTHKLSVSAWWCDMFSSSLYMWHLEGTSGYHNRPIHDLVNTHLLKTNAVLLSYTTVLQQTAMHSLCISFCLISFNEVFNQSDPCKYLITYKQEKVTLYPLLCSRRCRNVMLFAFPSYLMFILWVLKPSRGSSAKPVAKSSVSHSSFTLILVHPSIASHHQHAAITGVKVTNQKPPPKTITTNHNQPESFAFLCESIMQIPEVMHAHLPPSSPLTGQIYSAVRVCLNVCVCAWDRNVPGFTLASIAC